MTKKEIKKRIELCLTYLRYELSHNKHSKEDYRIIFVWLDNLKAHIELQKNHPKK